MSTLQKIYKYVFVYVIDATNSHKVTSHQSEALPVFPDGFIFDKLAVVCCWSSHLSSEGVENGFVCLSSS